MQNLAILGSTGSVGTSTLDVVARHPDKFSVYALTANTNVEKMVEQCIAFQPNIAIMANANAAEELHKSLIENGLNLIKKYGDKHSEEELADIYNSIGFSYCFIWRFEDAIKNSLILVP